MNKQIIYGILLVIILTFFSLIIFGDKGVTENNTIQEIKIVDDTIIIEETDNVGNIENNTGNNVLLETIEETELEIPEDLNMMELESILSDEEDKELLRIIKSFSK